MLHENTNILMNLQKTTRFKRGYSSRVIGLYKAGIIRDVCPINSENHKKQFFFYQEEVNRKIKRDERSACF